MNRNVGIATVIGIVIIIGVISFQIYDSSYKRSTTEEYYSDTTHSDEKNIKHVVYPENPQTLRGVTINKDKYLIGENVFLKINNISILIHKFVSPVNIMIFKAIEENILFFFHF